MKSKLKHVIVLAGIILFFGQCTNKNDFQPKFQELNGNSFVMQVERLADEFNYQFPSDEINESSYKDIEPFIQHDASFSNDGQLVTIIVNNQPISGQLQKQESNLKSFSLTEGLFAGGRLNVSVEADNLKFEYTVYGSGVPIIFSVRGRFIPVE